MSLRNLKCLLIEDAYSRYSENNKIIKTTFGDDAESGYGVIDYDLNFVKNKYDSVTADDINKIINN